MTQWKSLPAWLWRLMPLVSRHCDLALTPLLVAHRRGQLHLPVPPSTAKWMMRSHQSSPSRRLKRRDFDGGGRHGLSASSTRR